MQDREIGEKLKELLKRDQWAYVNHSGLVERGKKR